LSYCFFVQSLMMIPIPTTTTKERLAPCPTSTRRSPARNSYFVVTGASFFIDSVGTGEIRKGPLTFGERIRRRVGWLLSRNSPVWAWREMKASDARRNGWPVVTEIQVNANANATEQNRTEQNGLLMWVPRLCYWVLFVSTMESGCIASSGQWKGSKQASGAEWSGKWQSQSLFCDCLSNPLFVLA